MIDAPYILLGEDSEDDTFFAKRCFSAAGAKVGLKRSCNGLEVCDALNGCGADLPLAVLLDLKMPMMDGFETLKWIREHPKFKDLPVVILSSSGMLEDRARAEALGCTEYLVKPNSLHELEILLADLGQRLLAMAAAGATQLSPSRAAAGDSPGTVRPIG